MELSIALQGDKKIKVARWDATQHLRHIEDGEWLPMLDPRGNVLEGIVGKRGVGGQKRDGSRIGADFIKIDPGYEFPLHTHEGEHEIYFISGRGFVHIDGKIIPVKAKHVIHVPGEYPHGVGVPYDATEPLTFLAVGHPHHAVDSAERMQYPRT